MRFGLLGVVVLAGCFGQSGPEMPEEQVSEADPMTEVAETLVAAEGDATGSDREARITTVRALLETEMMAQLYPDLLEDRLRARPDETVEEALTGMTADVVHAKTVQIEVGEGAWSGVVPFAYRYRTTDGWTELIAGVQESAKEAGVATGYLAVGQTEIELVREAEAIAVVSVPEDAQLPMQQGVLVFVRGKEPVVVEATTAAEVWEAVTPLLAADPTP